MGSPDDDVRQAARLSVSFVNSCADLPGELSGQGFPAPLEGRWLYEVLEQSGLQKQFDLLYAIIYERNAPVGAAPVFVMNVPMDAVCPEKLLKILNLIGRILPSVLFQRTLFVGSPGAAEGSIGLLPGISRRAALFALQSALEKEARDVGAELIIWRDMPEYVSLDLEWLTKRRRLFRAVSLPSTVVRFRSNQKSDYLAQLKASHRRKVKSKLRQSADAVSVLVEIVRDPSPKVLDEMFHLFRQTFLRAKIKFEELPRLWFANIAKLQTTSFVVLRDRTSGGMLAVAACFSSGPMLIARHVGLDYSKPMSWKLYFRLWDAIVDWGLSEGFTSVLSGPSAYVAKIQLGHELVPLFNYIWHRNPFMHAIYRSVARRLGWAMLDEGLASFLKVHADAEIKKPREAM